MKDTDKLEDLVNEAMEYLIFDLFADGVAAAMKGMFGDAHKGDMIGSKELAVCLRNIADIIEYDASNLTKYIEVSKVLYALSSAKAEMQENNNGYDGLLGHKIK